MARNVYGLDLGTYEIKVFDKKQNKIMREKNVIAISHGKDIFSIGDTAYEMYEKTPDYIQVLFPMKQGVISRFDDMQYLLQNLLGRDNRISRGADYLLAVPTDVTEVEKRAFYDLVMHSSARAKQVRIIERGIADAVGLGLDVPNEKGIFIANFGGETTELSVLASGGMVLNKLIKIGGVNFDAAVAELVRRNKDLLIGRLTSERLRREFGVFNEKNDASLNIAGRNLLTGLPDIKTIPIGLVRAAIKDPLEEIVKSILSMIDRLPPDVRRIINKEGIFITGGLSNLPGLDTYLREVLGLRVRKAKRPELCVVEGLSKIILNKELSALTYSMLDEDYRWLH